MKPVLSEPRAHRAHLPSIRLVVATAAAALAASLALALSTPATISVDGQRVASDVAPVTLPGETYLPLRAVSEAAGARTTFDASTGTIAVQRGTETLAMHAGSTAALLNGHAVTLAHAPFVVHGRAMVSGATIAASLGSSVRYDAKRGRVVVRTPGVVVAGAADDEP